MTPNQQADGGSPTCGLAEWSALHGIDSHTGLMITGTLLSHLAGPYLSFLGQPGLWGARLPTLAISESDGATRRAIQNLGSTIIRVQERLVNFSHEFRMDEVADVMFRKRRGITATDEVGEALDAGTPKSKRFDKDPLALFNMDIANGGDRATRYDTLTRPRMMIEGSLPQDLVAAAGQCHNGRGLLGGCIAILPADPAKRAARIEMISRILEGEETAIAPHLTRSAIQRQTVSLGGIIGFPARTYPLLFDQDRDFLSRLIPFSGTPTRETIGSEHVAAAELFIQKFHRSAMHVIALRRAGFMADAGFSDPSGKSEFLNLRHRYLSKLTDHPLAVNAPEIAQLPALAAWTLIQLTNNKLADDRVISMAFAAAEHTWENTHRIFTGHEQAADARRHMDTAEAIIRKLKQKEHPVTHFELLRSFNKQSKIIYERPIEVLLERGLVERDDQNRYRLAATGPISLKLQDFIG